MAFRIKSSHIIALCITAGIAGWMATGTYYFGGQAAPGEEAAPIAEREAERSSELFKVRYIPLQPENRPEAIMVRGRTSADATVPIRAETAGVVEKRLVAKGDRVNAGDLVCVIERGVRQSRVAQAEAQLEQALADYESNSRLKDKGFASDNKLKQMKASLDAAKALLAEARWDLQRTEIRASVTGLVVNPVAEPGDMLKVGETCVTLMDTDPMLFIGQVSERDIGRIETGMKAAVALVSGEKLTGTIRYIAPAADAATRTFRTEIELDAPGGEVRDGLTATAEIRLDGAPAYRISPSWITLADDGEIGVRVVGDNDEVAFVPIHIVAQGNDGFWITGPEPGMRIITLGQEYVVSGEKVEPVPDPMLKAELEKPRSGGDQ